MSAVNGWPEKRVTLFAMWMRAILPDGTIVGEEGKVLHFSIRQFVESVVKDGCCFICGRPRSDSVPFNDEHVVPKWILRRFNLFDDHITLPNRAHVPYRSYKVPCCVECNSKLGERLETPVSELFGLGFSKMMRQVTDEDVKLIHCWVALLFLKMMLKDLTYRWELDARNGLRTIGDDHEREGFHHIQCLARTPVIGATLDDSARGTMIFVPAVPVEEPRAEYDYGDHTMSRTVMVRIGDVYLFTVLNDAGMTQQVVEPYFRRLGALTGPQAREVNTHLAFNSLRLTERPDFRTRMDPRNGALIVEATVPEEYSIMEANRHFYGGMLHFACLDLVNAQNEQAIMEGRWSCVFDDNDTFIQYPR